MAITISTNNGTRISLAHNRRDRKMVEQENAKWAEKHPGELRIDPNGHWEEWKNEGLKKTYEKLFADSVAAYNEKQMKAGKKSRVISDYLGELRAKEGSSKNAKHPLYEIIYQAGSKENPVEEAVGRQILRELYEGFAERNPHLYVLTAHYHADEAGSGYGKTAGHLHLTYIPVATGCKRGPETQNSLSSALRQQGIEATAYSKTEQMEWERRENAALEVLCRKYGYEVVHPQAGTKQEHLSVEEFKLKKEIEAAEERLEQVAALPLGKALVSKGRLEELEKTEAEYAAARKEIAIERQTVRAAKEAMAAIVAGNEELAKRKEQFEQEVNAAAKEKLERLRNYSLGFLKERGLTEDFSTWLKRSVKASQRIT